MNINRLTSWLRHTLAPRKTRRSVGKIQLKAERLEEREAPAIFTVTWDGFTGPQGTKVSLVDAINAANANPGSDTIRFATGITNVRIATFEAVVGNGFTGPLPDITGTTIIDGLAGSGGATKAVIQLTSKNAADPLSGFNFLSTAANSQVIGLTIMDPGAPANFNAVPTEFGVKTEGGAGNIRVQNVLIQGIDGNAVEIINSPNNIIGGVSTNQSITIQNNNGHGVLITGAASIGNHVEQATIRLNAGDGVYAAGGSSVSQIGSGSAALGTNVITQNGGSGIHLDDSDGNFVQRNFSGTNAAGDPGLGNNRHGVFVENGSDNNLIGGNDTTLNAGNKLSGNLENGLYVLDSAGNKIQCNVIGIDPSQTNVALANNGNGVLVENSANTRIGSTTTAANFIGGNNQAGIAVIGPGSAGSIVVNNRIGIGGQSLTTKLDTKIGNVEDGIFISNTSNITVGGGGTNAPNISGANRNGIAVLNSSLVTIKGNQLGINKLADNTYPNLGNIGDGIYIEGSQTIQIGGTQSLEGNKSALNRNGIHIINTNGVTLQGNRIGTNLNGVSPGTPSDPNQPSIGGKGSDGQAEDGVLVEGSQNVVIGTPAQGGGNLISRNRHGISIVAGSSNVTIQNNRIGSQIASPFSFAGTLADLGNQDDGIFIDNSSDVLIGGTLSSNANLLAKNLDGIQISSGSSNVTVQQNIIRNNSQSGVRIEGSTNVLVGGTTAKSGNIMANRKVPLIDTTFTIDGVFITGGSTNNTVQGNLIGTDTTNSSTIGLIGNGVLVDGASNNLIGQEFVGLPTSSSPQVSNTIVFNAFNGVAVDDATGPSVGNRILGNSIFSNGRLGIDLDNTAGDVTFNDFNDVDVGANNKQNFPVIATAESDITIGTRIGFAIDGTPGATYRVEFFHINTPNPTGNPVNYGQAKTYLGFMNVANGVAATFQNTNIVLPSGEFVTATATDIATGDTSEFGLDTVIIGGIGPVTYVVNNDGNIFPDEGADLLIPPNGGMTLATAIRLANEHPGVDRIVFALHPQYTISGSTITYYQESRNLYTNGDLPDITETLIIDGSPFAWPQVKGGDKRFTQNYGIVFNKGTHGLRISDNPTAQSKFTNPNAKAEFVILRNLGVSGGVAGAGVEIIDTDLTNNNVVQGANLQGVTISGFTSDGVRIVNSPNNIIGGSGAGQTVSIQAVSGTGVNVLGAASTKNLIQQTSIGTTFGAGGNGIWIQGADDNTIGGFTAGTGVQIQASGANGIYLLNSNGTRIQRSTIGDPTNKFPNAADGIRVENSGKSLTTATSTLIGGVSAAAGNTIAGNTEMGIRVLGGNSAGLLVQSNQIGTSTAPNSGHGIFVNNVPNVLIGSTVSAANNVDGNNRSGIYLLGASAFGARIINTSVGKNGGNIEDGIVIDGVSDVIVGVPSANGGGTIAGNRRGISALNGSSKITVQQMTISKHSEEGIRLDGASSVLIGGTSSALAGNAITGNRDGIRAIGSDVVTIQGNAIQTHAEDGVIIDGTGNVIVGSPFQFGGNLISGNRNGVRVINGSANFKIENNIIGSGTGAAGNTDDGIVLEGIVGAQIGGTDPLSGNFVSGNRNGLHMRRGELTSNFPYKATSGTVVLGNVFANGTENGVLIEGSSNNTIGGDTVAERNVISSNALNGLFLKPDFTDPGNPTFSNNNVIQGNFIGVNQAGTGNFGNGNAGVYIDGGNNNLIGGTVHDLANKLEEGNLIGNSGASGVAVVTDNGKAQGNRIIGNGIFNAGRLAIDLNGNIGLVDFNDLNDVDGGNKAANNTQNFPEITFAEVGLVSSLASGKLNSTPLTTFRVEFFGDAAANPNGTPTGYGQGATFLGSIDVTTDAFGNADFDFFAPVSFAAGGIISATATNLTTGDTSEFAKSKTVQVAVGKIEGIKFDDTDGDGIFDVGEPGLPGWVIELEVADANGVFDGKVDASATTDATGKYSFATLTDGTYQLEEVLQPGWVQTASPNPNPMQITGGATLTDIDFGNFKTVKVTGVKFEDKNGNAIRDAGEGPIGGVTINLMDAKTGTVLATTATDKSGNYAFTGLFVGKFGKNDTGFYRVREVVPAGFTQTTANPPDFQIFSGVDIGPLNFGNQGKGGGGVVGNNIIVAGSGPGQIATVRAFNTGSKQLFSLQPYGTTFKNGVRVAKGDVTGDGQLDIIVAPGPGTAPLVKVYDGANGKLFSQIMAYPTSMTRGVFVGAGDVNDDGIADIITGTDSGVTTQVKVFDGLTNIELFNFNPYAASFRGGVRVAGGDVNGDGMADIITAPGSGIATQIKVYDGSTFGTGTTLLDREFTAFETTFRRGAFVTVGNLNGDVFGDIIVTPDVGRQPHVYMYDGASGTKMGSFLIPPTNTNGQISSDANWTAGVRVGTIDMNGDGIDDITTGPGGPRQPRLRGFTSKGAKVVDFLAFPTNFMGGIYVG